MHPPEHIPTAVRCSRPGLQPGCKGHRDLRPGHKRSKEEDNGRGCWKNEFCSPSRLTAENCPDKHGEEMMPKAVDGAVRLLLRAGHQHRKHLKEDIYIYIRRH